MAALYSFLKPILFRLDPEHAHLLASYFIRSPFSAALPRLEAPLQLSTNLLGTPLAHPIGLAAGFDKNALMHKRVGRLGFSFSEVGGVTKNAQSGNKKPRLFRETQHTSIINRMGFNNQGMQVIKQRLENAKAFRPHADHADHFPIAVNIGLNKETNSPIEDYVSLTNAFADSFFISVNISSPNTPGLRNWQDKGPLKNLLAQLKSTKASEKIFLKISPDMEEAQLLSLVDLAIDYNIAGLILTNTTTYVPPYLNANYERHGNAGGISGIALKERANAALKIAATQARGRLILIGVGGMMSGQDAYEKLSLGASFLEIYSALVFHGPLAVHAMIADLARLMDKRHQRSLSQVIGQYL